ncbi:MAG: zinc-binding dehydrogenase [Pseudomonadota bacterium]
MRAAVFHAHGPTSNIRVEDFPEPEVGPNDCKLRVKAVSLNGFEPMIIGKTTALKTPLPMIPGGDVAGEIVAMGEAVDREKWQLGDRVTIYPMVAGEGMTGESRIGGCSEFVRIPSDHMVRIPDGVSDVDASTAAIAYATALRMLVTRGQVKAGESVLVLGASGGVGTACVQLAVAAGCEVIACASADWKLERLKALGAHHVVNTATQDLREFVLDTYGKPRMGAGGGVDVVVNYIGGDTWLPCLKLIHPGGRMLTCGATAGYATDNDVRYIWTYELNILGSNGWTMEDQATMLSMIDDGRISPVVHGVRELEQTAASIQDLIDRSVFGKLVIAP